MQTLPVIDYSDQPNFAVERMSRLSEAKGKGQDSLTLRSPTSYAGVALRRLSNETLTDQHNVNISSSGALLLDEGDDAGVHYDPIGHVRLRFMDNYMGQQGTMTLDADTDVYMEQRTASIVIIDGLHQGSTKAINDGDFIYLVVGVGFKPYRVVTQQPQMAFGDNTPLYLIEPSGDILYDPNTEELAETGDL